LKIGTIIKVAIDFYYDIINRRRNERF